MVVDIPHGGMGMISWQLALWRGQVVYRTTVCALNLQELERELGEVHDEIRKHHTTIRAAFIYYSCLQGSSSGWLGSWLVG